MPAVFSSGGRLATAEISRSCRHPLDWLDALPPRGHTSKCFFWQFCKALLSAVETTPDVLLSFSLERAAVLLQCPVSVGAFLGQDLTGPNGDHRASQQKIRFFMSADRVLIRVGHSPDPDDAFMFHALANDSIETGRYQFVHELQDIETLNRRAFNGELELTAVSIHGFAFVEDKYALCACGASMGDNYGPMVVAREPLAISDLKGKKIAVPGTLTSAFLSLKLLLGDTFEYEVEPFDEILNLVEQGRYDAGLIIHEGQLTYASQGLKLIVDLGKWWYDETGGLPVPLGGNAIRRDLGPAAMLEVTALLKQSIQYGLDHREAALQHAMKYGRDLDHAKTDRFVGMYVNDWTVDFGAKGREAVRLLLRRGYEAGVIPKLVVPEFIG